MIETAAVDVNEFVPFRKIPRYSRECVITEKIDGTNAQIKITNGGAFFVGSRTRWLDEHNDNYGFFKWATENKEELLKLGAGTHYGEWWGLGIQRNYGLREKRLSLFNVERWSGADRVLPSCCSLVPVICRGPFGDDKVAEAIECLKINGSYAQKGYMNPEGIVIFHSASRMLFKKTIDGDEYHKGENK